MRRWTFPRITVGVVVAALLVLDLYAMYSGWFGWDGGGFHVVDGVLDNWDDRNGRGIVLAVPLAVALAFVLWGWPRIIGRISAERADIREAVEQYRRVHSWDEPASG